MSEFDLEKLAREIAATWDGPPLHIHIAPNIIIQFYNVKAKMGTGEIEAYVKAHLKEMMRGW